MKYFLYKIQLTLLCFLLISCSSSTTLNYQDKLLNGKTFQSTLLSSQELKNIVDISYYQGKDVDGFSSSSIRASLPDPYQMYWTLSIMRKLNYNNEQFDQIKQNYRIKKVWDEHQLEMENIRLISGVDKLLNNVDLAFKSNSINFLKKHYNKQESLFYMQDKNESICEC